MLTKLITSWDRDVFEADVEAACQQGFTIGTLSTCTHPLNSGVCYSMVMAMTYIPQTGNQTVTAVSAAYSVAPADQYIQASTSGNNYAITLPAATGSGRTLNIKKITSSNTITITPTGTDTIDGGSNLTLKQINTAYSLIDAAVGAWQIF